MDRLSWTLGPVPGHIHRVVQDAKHVDTLLGTVQDVQEEMSGGPATLRDVKEPPVSRQAFTVMAEVRVFADALAGFGDQRAILGDLQRSEVNTGSAKDLADVGLRDVA